MGRVRRPPRASYYLGLGGSLGEREERKKRCQLAGWCCACVARGSARVLSLVHRACACTCRASFLVGGNGQMDTTDVRRTRTLSTHFKPSTLGGRSGLSIQLRGGVQITKFLTLVHSPHSWPVTSTWAVVSLKPPPPPAPAGGVGRLRTSAPVQSRSATKAHRGRISPKFIPRRCRCSKVKL